MAVLNCTPDSFYDGSSDHADKRVDKALKFIQEGANIIDIGGESSRPGSEPVSETEELNRVLPIIEKLRQKSNINISIDTTKAAVAEKAIQAGANIINDISAGSDPDMLNVALRFPVKVIHMHMQGTPKSMQVNPQYENVITEVLQNLKNKRDNWRNAGFDVQNLIWDPGIGFGKNLEHNLKLMKHLQTFTKEAPIVLGISRKSFISKIDSSSLGPEDRLAGSLAPLSFAWDAGVRIFRVHDVAATRQFLLVHESLRKTP
jgi:dihydropteroate synthase